jgi:DNA-directed RNA polymerase subunit RPC12/RpoP
MSDISFNCPFCGHNLLVDRSGVGMTVPCPACSKTIIIQEKAGPYTDYSTSPHPALIQSDIRPSKSNNIKLSIACFLVGVLATGLVGYLYWKVSFRRAKTLPCVVSPNDPINVNNFCIKILDVDTVIIKSKWYNPRRERRAKVQWRCDVINVSLNLNNSSTCF